MKNANRIEILEYQKRIIQLERRNKEKSLQVKQIYDIINEQIPEATKDNYLDHFKTIMKENKANSDKMQIITVAKNNLETKNV